MATKKKALQAAAGNAGGVQDEFFVFGYDSSRAKETLYQINAETGEEIATKEYDTYFPDTNNQAKLPGWFGCWGEDDTLYYMCAYSCHWVQIDPENDFSTEAYAYISSHNCPYLYSPQTDICHFTANGGITGLYVCGKGGGANAGGSWSHSVYYNYSGSSHNSYSVSVSDPRSHYNGMAYDGDDEWYLAGYRYGSAGQNEFDQVYTSSQPFHPTNATGDAATSSGLRSVFYHDGYFIGLDTNEAHKKAVGSTSVSSAGYHYGYGYAQWEACQDKDGYIYVPKGTSIAIYNFDTDTWSSHSIPSSVNPNTKYSSAMRCGRSGQVYCFLETATVNSKKEMRWFKVDQDGTMHDSFAIESPNNTSDDWSNRSIVMKVARKYIQWAPDEEPPE